MIKIIIKLFIIELSKSSSFAQSNFFSSHISRFLPRLKKFRNHFKTSVSITDFFFHLHNLIFLTSSFLCFSFFFILFISLIISIYQFFASSLFSKLHQDYFEFVNFFYFFSSRIVCIKSLDFFDD